MASDLKKEQVERYSRQLLLSEFGVEGQKSLCNSSVLIVGAGGLGSSAALYLASAGIGTLGIVDYDKVELNNLHRQIIHRESTVGINKAESAQSTLQQLNSQVTYRTYDIMLDSSNALDLVSTYDIVLDCTDNMATRYLLNDACVLSGKPLVSGSALRFQGQLTVYHYRGGPCYRCMFPTPPPPSAVSNCSEAGVLGAIVGVIGSLQALQAIHILTNHSDVLSQSMLFFDGACASTMFRTIKLRSRDPNCVVCGDHPTVRHLVDYEAFCGQRACDKIIPVRLLTKEDRISAKALLDMLRSVSKQSHSTDANAHFLLVDVRPLNEYKMCRLLPSINIPFTASFEDNLKAAETFKILSQTQMLVVICHRGNDSQRALLLMKPHFSCIKDVIGGYEAYSQLEEVHDFPSY